MQAVQGWKKKNLTHTFLRVVAVQGALAEGQQGLCVPVRLTSALHQEAEPRARLSQIAQKVPLTWQLPRSDAAHSVLFFGVSTVMNLKFGHRRLSYHSSRWL